MKREEVRGLRFLVLGAARSGTAAARLLKMHGADVVVADSRSAEDAGALVDELARDGIHSVWGDEAIRGELAGRQVLVKSPGIPQSNALVLEARALGTRVVSEIELASAFVPAGARVVAITGTNGKTTVTAWLTHVLAGCGYDAVSAGNIGDAWAARLLEPPADASRTVYVVEVSSFQLEDVEDFRPDVAMVTNISPDHMDRYDDQMALYVAAKANILKNMAPPNVFVWNGLDASSGQFLEVSQALNWAFCAGGRELPGGGQAQVWAENGRVWARERSGAEGERGGASSREMLAVEELPLPGRHNLENGLAVIAAALALGGDEAKLVAALKTFAGVEHRIELCGRRADGVAFYNDSKATNLDAMQQALVAFEQPMVLIAGGRDAHSDYGSISHLVKKHVSHLVTLGEAAPLIEDAWGGIVPTRRASSMDEAVELANGLAAAGSVVVFSPGCKSFDMYSNFEERGRDFKRSVGEVLAGKTQPNP